MAASYAEVLETARTNPDDLVLLERDGGHAVVTPSTIPTG
jgi:hypothetical protein